MKKRISSCPTLGQPSTAASAAVVTIYVLRHCPNCRAAYQMADTIRRDFPLVQVDLVDLAEPGVVIPAELFAVPTYWLNGQRWSLGNPSPAQVQKDLGRLIRSDELEIGPAVLGQKATATAAANPVQHPVTQSYQEESIVKTEERATTVQPAEKMRYLSELAVFQDLSPREMEELNRITTMSTVPKGRVFYRPEEPGEVLFILKEGRVQLYRISPEGKKLVITTLGPHTLFGEMALLGAKMHNTFAEAVEDCLICVMSRTDLERLILSKPQVALRLLEITGKRLREAEERLENMAFKGIPARLASLLLRVAEEQGSDEITGLTHQDLAESVGTYRETATQVLNDLKAGGYIEIGRKRIKLLNREGLEMVAES